MRRELPTRPHIDHLKKQARDLLDAQQAGEREALERIAAALPALAGRTAEQVAYAPFALHDAQSVIAREYGYRSWSELRAAVAARTTASYSEANLRALIRTAATYTGQPLPEAMLDHMRNAAAARELAVAAASAPLPERLPLLAVRNWLILRPSIAPLYIGRPASLAAVQAAAASGKTLVAVAQRVETDEEAQLDGLHPVGCEVLLHSLHPGPLPGQACAVFEGLRQVRVTALEPAATAGGARYARVEPCELDIEHGADDIHALTQRLRSCAAQLAGLLPDPEPARALLASLDDQDLPNAVAQNLKLSVAQCARLAEEPRLVERLRMALGWAEAVRSAAGLDAG